MASNVTSGIYAIVNTVTGHRYIGSAKDVARRLQAHRSVPINQRLAAAYQRHGASAFTTEVLEEVDPDDDLLELAERRWIAHFVDLDRASVYNVHLAAWRVRWRPKPQRPRQKQRQPTPAIDTRIVATPPRTPREMHIPMTKLTGWIRLACQQSDDAQTRGDSSESERWLAFAQRMIDDMPHAQAQIRQSLAQQRGDDEAAARFEAIAGGMAERS